MVVLSGNQKGKRHHDGTWHTSGSVVGKKKKPYISGTPEMSLMLPETANLQLVQLSDGGQPEA